MSEELPEPRTLIVAATVHGRTLVLPARSGHARRWLIGFHGQGHNAAIMLDLMRPVPRGVDWLVASVQALHPFYTRSGEVVAGWMTRQDREHAIADNVAYVDGVLDALEREHGTPEAIVFAGFSQGVAMAYRAAVLGRRRGRAILAVAGDLPPELRAPREWPPVRIAVGTGEQWYTPERMEEDVAFLRAAGADVRAITFAGGHEWTAEVTRLAGELLAEVETEASL